MPNDDLIGHHHSGARGFLSRTLRLKSFSELQNICALRCCHLLQQIDLVLVFVLYLLESHNE
jgi:hypothetical protein